MKSILLNKMRFLSKSLLWSLVLYAAVVIALDWEAILRTIRKQPDIVLVNNEPRQLVGNKIAATKHITVSTGNILIDLMRGF